MPNRLIELVVGLVIIAAVLALLRLLVFPALGLPANVVTGVYIVIVAIVAVWLLRNLKT